MAAEDALAAPPASPMQVIADNFNNMTPRQKMAGAVVLALSIALLTGVWLWSRQPDFSVLFSNIAEKDGGAIVTALQQQNVPYKVESGGGTILVPANRANELRLLLASQGLPKGGLVGFELMETQKIGLSQFHEQINYQRALEGELARTIQSLAAVSGARVHLAIPKQSAFLRDEQKPTASVVVALQPGRRLDPAQVAGIVHLVSSSVPQLGSNQVSVIDQNGALLTTARDPRSAGLDASQLTYVESVEQSYIKRIETILGPVLGNGNFRAQVTADVDFDATEQTSETYKPNPSPDTAIRSEQTSEARTNQPPAAGVPGALSNQPPVPATAPLTSPNVPGSSASEPAALNSNRSATVNYELDKTVQHIKRSLGSVKRLSVAVVVNYKSEKDAKGAAKPVALSDEEMKRVDALVREAVGYNQQRGDTLNLANTAFAEVMTEQVVALPVWKDPEILAMAKEAARWLVLLGVLFIIWRSVIRPLMGAVLPAKKAEEEGEAGPILSAAEQIEEAKELGDEDLPPEVLEAELKKMSFEKKVARAKELAAKDPKMVAQLMKEWLSGGSGSGEGR